MLCKLDVYIEVQITSNQLVNAVNTDETQYSKQIKNRKTVYVPICWICNENIETKAQTSNDVLTCMCL